MYGVLRFLTGMGGVGCFLVAFVLVVEHVGYKVYLELTPYGCKNTHPNLHIFHAYSHILREIL